MDRWRGTRDADHHRRALPVTGARQEQRAGYHRRCCIHTPDAESRWMWPTPHLSSSAQPLATKRTAIGRGRGRGSGLIDIICSHAHAAGLRNPTRLPFEKPRRGRSSLENAAACAYCDWSTRDDDHRDAVAGVCRSIGRNVWACRGGAFSGVPCRSGAVRRRSAPLFMNLQTIAVVAQITAPFMGCAFAR